jgi:hypothetical protein
VFFFNDECDLIDDDQYDFFTLATPVERRRPSIDRACGRQTEKIGSGSASSAAQRRPEV